MSAYELRQARLLQAFRVSAATIEDLARAWASMDGKAELFDQEKDMPAADAVHGHFLGYTCEVEEILKRATGYAIGRKSASR